MGDLVHQDLPPILAGGKRGRSPKAKAVAAPPRAQAQPKAKAGRGRPCKAEEKPRKTLATPPTQLENAFDGRAAFLAAEKNWAQSLIDGKTLAIRHQWLSCSNGFKVLLWCNSCHKCAKNQAGWSAMSQYDVPTQTFSRQYTPETAHGQFDLIRTWNPLTSTTETRLKAHMQSNTHVTTQDLLRIVDELQPDRPVPESFSENLAEEP